MTFYYLCLLWFCYYGVMKLQARKGYLDFDIIDTYIDAAAYDHDHIKEFKPFYDLCSDKPDVVQGAVVFMQHFLRMYGYRERYICGGRIGCWFLQTDLLYLIEINCNGNIVHIEVSHDGLVHVSDISIIADIWKLLNEGFVYCYYLSIFSDMLKKSKQGITKDFEYFEAISKFKARGLLTQEYRLNNELDYGMPYMQTARVVDDECCGINGILLTLDIFLGGLHLKVYSDVTGDIFFVDDRRLKKKHFIKSFKQGLLNWKMQIQQDKERQRV